MAKRRKPKRSKPHLKRLEDMNEPELAEHFSRMMESVDDRQPDDAIGSLHYEGMCFGGPYDGKTYASEHPQFDVAITSPFRITTPKMVTPSPRQVFTYQWRQLTEYHGVWASPIWDVERIIGHLLEHYRKHYRKTRRRERRRFPGG